MFSPSSVTWLIVVPFSAMPATPVRSMRSAERSSLVPSESAVSVHFHVSIGSWTSGSSLVISRFFTVMYDTSLSRMVEETVPLFWWLPTDTR